MMRPSYFILTSLICIAASTPMKKREDNSWPSPVRSFLEACSERINAIRSASAIPQPPSCTLASATLPTSSLPPPSAGLAPYHIAVGRGTQNYTCNTADPSAAPAAVGAVATLFNTSCLAAINPFVLALVPPAALTVPTPKDNKKLFPAQSIVSGHHYFSAGTPSAIPTFNLHTSRANYGITFSNKVANVSAPANTVTGESTLGPDGSKPVQWLKLQVNTPNGDVGIADEVGAVKEIYRVNTAGGTPPATCAGMPEEFDVQYAAEYWFFA